MVVYLTILAELRMVKSWLLVDNEYMEVSGSPLRHSPEREFTFLGVTVLLVIAAVPIGIRLEALVVLLVLLSTAYLFLRLIQAVERLAAATEELARESDELGESVQSWPWL